MTNPNPTYHAPVPKELAVSLPYETVERTVAFLPHNEELDARMRRGETINCCFNDNHLRPETPPPHPINAALTKAFTQAALTQLAGYFATRITNGKLLSASIAQQDYNDMYTKLCEIVQNESVLHNADGREIDRILALNPHQPPQRIDGSIGEVYLAFNVPKLEYKLDKSEGSKLYGVPDPICCYIRIAGPLIEPACKYINEAATTSFENYRPVDPAMIRIYTRHPQEWFRNMSHLDQTMRRSTK